MKKVFKTAVMLVVILLGAFSLYKLSNKYNLNVLKNNINCTIVAKGCEKAKAIAVDDDNNMYVAFSDYIKNIDKEGRERLIYKNKDLDIEDMVYYKDNLLLISGDSIYKYSISTEGVRTLSSDIPLSGNDIKRRLLVKDDILYIAVGARTNSGISEGEYEDLSPIDVTLSGVNYGANPTGIFKKYGTKSEVGENIKKSPVGNAAIYVLNLKNDKLNLYASGIRGIKGADFNSKGEMFALFSGMENKGLRPVLRDKDYIYKIEKGIWYGWPDFSGGDSIDSPRFKDKENIKPLLKNQQDKIVPAAIYQSSALNSLEGMAIDKEGNILEKDTIIFWDSSKEKICTLSVQNVYKEILKLKSNSHIESIVDTNRGILLLDNDIGCVYAINKKAGSLGFKVPLVILLFLFMLVICILIIILYKLLKSRKN